MAHQLSCHAGVFSRKTFRFQKPRLEPSSSPNHWTGGSSILDLMLATFWPILWNVYSLVNSLNYWKWPLIVDLPSKNGGFPKLSYVSVVYRRVVCVNPVSISLKPDTTQYRGLNVGLQQGQAPSTSTWTAMKMDWSTRWVNPTSHS
jgi:hypothetical protein